MQSPPLLLSVLLDRGAKLQPDNEVVTMIEGGYHRRSMRSHQVLASCLLRLPRCVFCPFVRVCFRARALFRCTRFLSPSPPDACSQLGPQLRRGSYPQSKRSWHRPLPSPPANGLTGGLRRPPSPGAHRSRRPSWRTRCKSGACSGATGW